MKKTFLILAAACTFGGAVGQQKITFSDAKFFAGSNTEYLKSNFDDKAWQTLQLNRDWDSQGYGLYDGYGIYRMRFDLPKSMLEKAYLKDSLIFYMGKIDDADETYLNGVLIGKTGQFPTDNGGYKGAHQNERIYKISTKHPALLWDKENVLAVKAYDGGGGGGMFEGIPYIRTLDLIDGVSLKAHFLPNKKGEKVCSLLLKNLLYAQITGTVNIEVIDTEQDKVISSVKQKINLKRSQSFSKDVSYVAGKRYAIKFSVVDDKTGMSLAENFITPYILTPKVADTPQINGAKVFGVRPNSPFFFKIPVTGVKPIRYSVENLPKELKLDAEKGIISGTFAKTGEYKMIFVAENAKGKARREFTVKVGDLLALTPPMGWNSWNCWGLSVSDTKVRSSAQALIDKGLIDYGWTYINIDDAWEADKRDSDGTLHANAKFPDMKALGEWLHSKGLRFGIYSSPGPYTCGRYLGSYGFEKNDAKMWANWGIDYLKYDWCDYWHVYEQEGRDPSLAAYMKPYQTMERELKAQNRDIVYSLCQYGMRDVWQWGAAVTGNLWRTTGDIVDTWASLYDIGFNRQTDLYQFAKPGHWNDPDMLVVGKVGWGENLHPSRLTYDEQYTHIALWSLLASPLLIGCDIAQLDDFTLNLLTNAEVIAVNQDPLGKQAKRVLNEGNFQVWVKELEDGSQAIGIFNLGENDEIFYQLDKGIDLQKFPKVRDLWRQRNLTDSNLLKKPKIPAHGVLLLQASK